MGEHPATHSDALSQRRFRIDIVIATLDRPRLLAACLASISRAADSREWLDLRVIVVENGRAGAASDILRAAGLQHETTYLHEPRIGKSRALNRALQVCSRDFIGFIDDDEQLAPDWFDVAHRELANHHIDFIGGPYVPDFECERPAWLPDAFPAAIGDTSHASQRTRYAADSGPVLMGGNMIVRRTLQVAVGEFRVDLGPGEGTRQRTGEDHNMFLRYLDAGATGYFVPELRILHFVPAQRLTKQHYRDFVRSHAAAQAVLDQERPPKVATLFGKPRYRYGVAARALMRLAFERDAAKRFQHELELRESLTYIREHGRISGGERRA